MLKIFSSVVKKILSGSIFLGIAIILFIFSIGQGASWPFLSGKLKVTFTDVIPFNYDGGRATQCKVVADINNESKYKFNKISLDVGGWILKKDGINANAKIDNLIFGTIDLDSDGRSNKNTCEANAQYIIDAMRTAKTVDCDITGMAEGDCQLLVNIYTTMNKGSIIRMSMYDAALAQKQLAPIADYLAEAGFAAKHLPQFDNQKMESYRKLFNEILKIDSASLSFTKYQVDSVNNLSLVEQDKDGSMLAIKGFYTFFYKFDGSQNKGWLILKITNDGPPCLIYHDFQSECRAIRLPNVDGDADKVTDAK
jgi:hypothetical protein